ncbi:hypothetical protein GY45DRAFT_1439429 [Cubamyces sp. BRFM 1775]|nr:hypothetical protein GY45DRAFT_1439429 [Cubamyces sp. BRFM 1775]
MIILQSPTAVSLENPVMSSIYEPHTHHIQPQFTGGQYMHHHHHQPIGGHVHDDKWGAQMFNAQVTGGPALFTPPASSQGAASPMNVGAPSQQQQAYLLSLQRHTTPKSTGAAAAP